MDQILAGNPSIIKQPHIDNNEEAQREKAFILALEIFKSIVSQLKY